MLASSQPLLVRQAQLRSLARAVVFGIAADATLVAVGLVATRRSRSGRPWLAVFGAIVQAHVVVTHLIELPPDLADVEAAGIPFAVAMVVSGDVQAGPRLAETLEGLVDPVQGAVLGLGRVVALTTLAVAVALSPLGDLADAQTRFLAVSLDPEANYADPAVREQITTDALAWVAKYREHPALRMWAIGNEVLHKLVYPSWMPMRSDPAWERRARDFAAFYVDLIDRVHAADPNHPIVHRDAEDDYLSWMRDAPQASGHRPWFIYGVNAYTPRRAEILDGWAQRGIPTSLLVSEYAPLNAPHGERADRYREIWDVIQARSSFVLGGAVYVWSTDGPEEVDRAFGLVDAGGNPVDDALDTISTLYHADARRGATLRDGSLDA